MASIIGRLQPGSGTESAKRDLGCISAKNTSGPKTQVGSRLARSCRLQDTPATPAAPYTELSLCAAAGRPAAAYQFHPSLAFTPTCLCYILLEPYDCLQKNTKH
jgi:hypothetical protein